MGKKSDRVRSEIFREKLVWLIERANLTPPKLADRVGVSRSVAYKWHDEGMMPTLDEALRIADLLGVTLEYLANDETKTPPTRSGRSEAEDRLWEQIGRLGIEKAQARLDYDDVRE